MDGWGEPELKGAHRNYIHKEPVQFTGFKLFFKTTWRKSRTGCSREELLKLETTTDIYSVSVG